MPKVGSYMTLLFFSSFFFYLPDGLPEQFISPWYSFFYVHIAQIVNTLLNRRATFIVLKLRSRYTFDPARSFANTSSSVNYEFTGVIAALL